MIKWIALILMIADHIGYYFDFLIPEPVVFALRLVGRLSFPIFAYSISLGYLRTKNRKRYFFRMLLFAIITQALLAITGYYTGINTFINVLFTFSISILMMADYDFLDKLIHKPAARTAAACTDEQNKSINRCNIPQEKQKSTRYDISALSGIVMALLLMILLLVVTAVINPDYNLFGVLSVMLFYIILKRRNIAEAKLQDDRFALWAMFGGFLGLNLIKAIFEISFSTQPMYWTLMEIFSVFSIGFLILDKPRKKPKGWEKYLFYIFYPAHLVLMMIIKYVMLRA